MIKRADGSLRFFPGTSLWRVPLIMALSLTLLVGVNAGIGSLPAIVCLALVVSSLAWPFVKNTIAGTKYRRVFELIKASHGNHAQACIQMMLFSLQQYGPGSRRRIVGHLKLKQSESTSTVDVTILVDPKDALILVDGRYMVNLSAVVCAEKRRHHAPKCLIGWATPFEISFDLADLGMTGCKAPPGAIAMCLARVPETYHVVPVEVEKGSPHSHQQLKALMQDVLAAASTLKDSNLKSGAVDIATRRISTPVQLTYMQADFKSLLSGQGNDAEAVLSSIISLVGSTTAHPVGHS